jgi:GT2 family glycosyltransferase
LIQDTGSNLKVYTSGRDELKQVHSQISIVVTSYTNERWPDLKDLLNSITMQSPLPEFVGVIERDQRLKENIIAYLEQTDFAWVVVFCENRLGISNARNIGVLHSHSPLIGFVDDDAVLLPGWTAYATEIFHHYPDAIGATGPALPLWIDSSTSWFPKSLYWMIGCTAWKEESAGSVVNSVTGANMVFRREAFRHVTFEDGFTDGFQQEGKLGLPNEDNDFAIRLVTSTSKKIIYFPSLKIYHKIYPFKVSSKYVKRYAFWQGIAEARYSRMYSSSKRVNLRKIVIVETFRDFLDIDRNWGKRLTMILMFISFGLLGMLSYDKHGLFVVAKKWL